ncbi:MAG: class I SAM-dependent methyltransferase [Planctomycetaceae bacterium]|jgi:SAM-dependent methyltransferase|nr:class I SAM-dependent methyltransferase [Planctomycetaceae bacterium]
MFWLPRWGEFKENDIVNIICFDRSKNNVPINPDHNQFRYMKCKFCQKELTHVWADLGTAPPSNSFLKQEQLDEREIYYPLKVFVCDNCFLAQIDEFQHTTEIFSDEYVYFSSMSNSWLDHAKQYVEMITSRLGLNSNSLVVEIASNDGYLLQYIKEKGIPCLGIEPTLCTANVARTKGILVIDKFFGTELALELQNKKQQADLLLGNNVLAHVPDINDFVAGLKIALKPRGTITMEFPHLMRLIEGKQFDTIYHEHFSYFSFGTICRIFDARKLKIYDVEELPTHGGSLRIFAKHAENNVISISENVTNLLAEEERRGMTMLNYYKDFSLSMGKIKIDFLRFLIERKEAGEHVAAYGAAAKGNTLLNFCGVKVDLIDFVSDKATSKQGKYLPGSRIPVYSDNEIKKRKPNYVIIFPWNIRNEIESQLSYIKSWNGKFVTAIPELKIT